jgi:hypothetical protein
MKPSITNIYSKGEINMGKKFILFEIEMPEDTPNEAMAEIVAAAHDMWHGSKEYKNNAVTINIDNGLTMLVKPNEASSPARMFMGLKLLIDKAYIVMRNRNILKPSYSAGSTVDDIMKYWDKKDAEKSERFPDLKKSENPNNPIKMDGKPDQFAGGAVRYTKNGKGRLDLVPREVAENILRKAWESFYANEGTMSTSKSDILKAAMSGSCNGAAAFEDVIMFMTILLYCEVKCSIDDAGEDTYDCESFDAFIRGYSDMILDVAHHYEDGAEKYGVDNWKKGIPVVGGERGGNFTDSFLRHLHQMMSSIFGEMETDENGNPVSFTPDNSDETVVPGCLIFDEVELKFYTVNEDGSFSNEEPHHRAVIWNAMCALWYIYKENHEKAMVGLDIPSMKSTSDIEDDEIDYFARPVNKEEENTESDKEITDVKIADTVLEITVEKTDNGHVNVVVKDLDQEGMTEVIKNLAILFNADSMYDAKGKWSFPLTELKEDNNEEEN